MKIFFKKAMILFSFFMVSAFYAGCAFCKEEVSCENNISETCQQQLTDCFGDAFSLSQGVEKEDRFFDEHENKDIITHYMEWELTYENAAGQECRFVFNNRNGRKPAEEYMEDSMESYFCSLVRQHYQQHFWDETIARIPGCRETDSTLYFQRYRLFSMPDVPETAIMFDERLHYSLWENISFLDLQYDAVFHDFPYILNMYLFITYQSSDETEQAEQCREAENLLWEMIDEMAQYTSQTLNAAVSVTMMDENGAAGGFSLAVLNGAYFERGNGIELEIALHENFFRT